MRPLDLRDASLAMVLMMPACSDDGVPETDTHGSSSGGGSTGNGDTVTTSASTTSASTGDGSSGHGDSSGPGTSVGDSTGSTGASSSETGGTGASSSESGSTGTSSGDSGSSGASSSEGSGDSSTGEPLGQCMDADDCQLVDDCCNCVVIPAGEVPPPCGLMECIATACTPLGGDAAPACELGSCELAPVPCNLLDLECDDDPPVCAAGTLPNIDPDTGCWTGLCVPTEACDVVPTCDDCPDDEACVELYTHFGPMASCSPIDPSCGGVADCACMGELCTSPFDSCSETPDGLGCSCPVC